MKQLKRNEVNINETWDLSDLFKSNQEAKDFIDKIQKDVNAFEAKYKTKLNNEATIVEALDKWAKLREDISRLYTYASLLVSTDQSNIENMALSGEISLELSDYLPKLNFVTQEIKRLDANSLENFSNQEYKRFIELIARDIPHMLDENVEDAISNLDQSLNAPYEIYNMAKLVDMDFDAFKHNDQEIKMSFGFYEDFLAFETDHELRHKAFDVFHGTLKKYENIFAGVYKSHVLKEKSLAKLHNFDSTIEYLLHDQEVSLDIYNNQIDTIMNKLAPHMRRFAKHLGELHGLDKMTYKDLTLEVDPDFEPNISITEAKDHLLEGLNILGDDYLEMVSKSFDERWIDFPSNLGKSTGAFCSSPYAEHPYILISWTKKMREVFVLAHELGHAGHFYLAKENQNIFNMPNSLFLIEAPSTMNELIMANHLKTTSDDPRFKRWILSTIISRTYYHNFVTHLLEAAYQREVYHKLDNNVALSATVLNQIFQEVLEDFWGDAVEISENSNLTWMRQPHYYMGLYPYTYSCGLNIATDFSQKLINGEASIDTWMDFLKAGGSKSPEEMTKILGIDLNNPQTLENTIEHIGAMIDEIIELSAEINQ